jgi:hypothetical protein
MSGGPRGLLVATFLVLAGFTLWQFTQLSTVSPQAPTIPTPSPLPSITPDGRIDTLLEQMTRTVPTPTNTPRPKITPDPTKTPHPLYGSPECTANVVCDQWTPTATATIRPADTAVPEPGPCGTPGPSGFYPRYCWGTD